ncbi:MAG: MFS transporter [Gemmatimonadetes bacterium]|nr:MFS transporter [Gemmatimonadota bacterium]
MSTVFALLLTASAIRAFVTGATGVLLGLYLAQRGLDAATLGVVVAAGLGGLAVGTAITGFLADRVGRKRALIGTAALSAVGLAIFALTSRAELMTLAAFFGMVNGMGRDRGPAQTVEQSVLADALPEATRTRAFTRYAFAQDVAGAVGSLAVSLPDLLAHLTNVPPLVTYRWAFLGLAGLSLGPVWLYLRLPRDVATRPFASLRAGSPADPPTGSRSSPPTRLSPESRRHVRGLSTLFALDSLGGGFLAGSIITYWFFRRHGLDGAVLGPVFFGARVLNALSYFGADFLAARIGLLRTMVFTHLPSSLLLVALPFVSTPGLAIGIFLLREALVQMDVPTRTSYVAAVTQPGERTLAMGITGLVRNVGWAVGPAGAGFAIRVAGLGAPLLIGAGLKTMYDLALYASFRQVRPGPEGASGPEPSA